MTDRSAGPATTLGDVMRGVAGGVILGLPLIYTQEVWLLGASIHPFAILALLAASFGLNFALSHFVGFRAGRTHRSLEDAIVGFGVSILLAAGLLLLLHRVHVGMRLENVIGIIALSSVPASLGFALGNAIAPKKGGEGQEQMQGGAGDLLAAAAGAVLLCLNIAPTEEPVLLAYEIGWVRLGAIVLVSISLSYLIVFYAEFHGRAGRAMSTGVTSAPSIETLLAYIVALVVSAGLLTAFGSVDSLDGANLAEILVLGFPASMGAALGRLLV